jgi:SCP-2 sterol transfer family
MPFPFLSDEWVEEARRLRAQYDDAASPFPQVVRMNLVVTEVPFGAGTLDAHVDTTGGAFDIETGHVDGPDLSVTVDYATAKAILIEGNAQAGMQAFMAGKVRVDGDISKLMALQGGNTSPAAQELAVRLRAITE